MEPPKRTYTARNLASGTGTRPFRIKSGSFRDRPEPKRAAITHRKVSKSRFENLLLRRKFWLFVWFFSHSEEKPWHGVSVAPVAQQKTIGKWPKSAEKLPKLMPKLDSVKTGCTYYAILQIQLLHNSFLYNYCCHW